MRGYFLRRKMNVDPMILFDKILENEFRHWFSGFKSKTLKQRRAKRLKRQFERNAKKYSVFFRLNNRYVTLRLTRHHGCIPTIDPLPWYFGSALSM